MNIHNTYPLPLTWSLDNSYVLLPNLPLLDNKHIEQARTSTYFPPHKENTPKELGTRVQSSNTDPLPFTESKFCQDIKNYFGNVVAKYSIMNPFTMYDWHQDIDRPYCINTLIIQPPNAMTLHRKPINRMVYDIREVEYVMTQPLLFNSSIPHCVINNSNQARCIMSISMIGSKRTWDEAKQWLLNYRIDSFE